MRREKELFVRIPVNFLGVVVGKIDIKESELRKIIAFKNSSLGCYLNDNGTDKYR